MFVVFLHGPPAAGKHTIGTRLAQRLDLPLFHNHLAVDLARSLFDFGTPGFIALREQIWLASFRAAVAEDRSFIFTFNPEATVAPDLIGRLQALVEAASGKVHYIELKCPDSVVESRLADPSRAAFGKLRDVPLYRSIRAAGGFAFPPLPPPLLVIDTAAVSAEAAAAVIQRAIAGPQ
jgi:hypothetical protein